MYAFSVIVPIYNVERYLRQCLDSLVQQTYADKEIILVDDGSTDSSGKICDEYAERYDCVRVVHQDNQGVSAARNAGISVATGEWFSFIDADDWVDSDMLEQLQGDILATNADLYRFGAEVIDEKGARIRLSRLTKKPTIVSFADEQAQFRFYCQRHNLNMDVLQTVWTGIYRRDIIREHGIAFVDRDEVIFEDTLFNYHYFLHTHKILFLPGTPYHYRRHKESFCHTTDADVRVLGNAALGEHAYRYMVKQGLPYFQEYFHHHYFLFLNTTVWTIARGFSNEHLRQLLDILWENDLHRSCIRKIRQESDTFIDDTCGRVWYDENFGLNK